MAFQDSPDDEPITSINITPLVDIFLVLLIIFMITSTVMDPRSIALRLPKAANAGTEAPKATGVVLDSLGNLFVDGGTCDSAGLVNSLRAAVRKDKEHQVLISAHDALPYRDVIRILDWIRGSGIHKYALKVERPGL